MNWFWNNIDVHFVNLRYVISYTFYICMSTILSWCDNDILNKNDTMWSMVFHNMDSKNKRILLKSNCSHWIDTHTGPNCFIFISISNLGHHHGPTAYYSLQVIHDRRPQWWIEIICWTSIMLRLWFTWVCKIWGKIIQQPYRKKQERTKIKHKLRKKMS